MMGRRDKKRRAAYHRKARLETTESVPPLNQEFVHELAEAVEARPHEDPEILGNEDLAACLIVAKSAINDIRELLNDYAEMRNGHLVSVDSLVWDIRFSSPEAGLRMQSMMAAVQSDGVPEETQTNKPMSYRYLASYRMGGGTVVLMVGFNELGGKTDMTRARLDFNPNKVGHCCEIRLLMRRLGTLSKSIELNRYDVAVDIPAKREDVMMVKDKRGYQYVNHNHGITEYLGRRNKTARVKLYDKTRESNLVQDWTRLELTCAGGWSASEILDNMPEVRAWKYSHDGSSERERAWVRCVGMLAVQVNKLGGCAQTALNSLGRTALKKVLEFVTCENSPLESGYAGYALRVCSEWEREFYGDADWDSLEEAKTCCEASY